MHMRLANWMGYFDDRQRKLEWVRPATKRGARAATSDHANNNNNINYFYDRQRSSSNQNAVVVDHASTVPTITGPPHTRHTLTSLTHRRAF